MDKIDPEQFKPRPKRTPQEIAKAILTFIIDQHPSLEHPQDNEMPTQFGIAVDEIIFDILMDATPEEKGTIKALLRRQEELEKLMQALGHIARGDNPATTRIHLRKAPELLELLTQHWDMLAKDAYDEARSMSGKALSKIPADDELLGWLHDPDKMGGLIGGVLESYRELKWSAQNMRQHIAPLFRELADALGIGGADQSMGQAFD